MSGKRVAAELIYDAILDDALFAELPAVLARAYGGRSCNILWQPVGQPFQLSARCGYFADEHMRTYVEEFADKDHWALRALTPDKVNRVQDCTQYVPPAEYERTEFYNDWIRGIGDDTYHCMGMMVGSSWGTGLIGFHKGRTQSAFSDEEVRGFSDDGVHLRRMLALRGRINAAETASKHAGGVLDSLGFPIFSVDAELRLLMSNMAAEAMLSAGALFVGRGGRLRLRTPEDTRRLSELVAGAADRESPVAGAMIIRAQDGSAYQLSAVAMQTDTIARRPVVLLVTPYAADETIEARLRDLFSLTPAEAEAAAAIASGHSPRSLAEARSVSIETVRTQLKAIYAKMGCRSRGEMVAAVRSLPRVSR